MRDGCRPLPRFVGLTRPAHCLCLGPPRPHGLPKGCPKVAHILPMAAAVCPRHAHTPAFSSLEGRSALTARACAAVRPVSPLGSNARGGHGCASSSHDVNNGCASADHRSSSNQHALPPTATMAPHPRRPARSAPFEQDKKPTTAASGGVLAAGEAKECDMHLGKLSNDKWLGSNGLACGCRPAPAFGLSVGCLPNSAHRHRLCYISSRRGP